MASKISAIAITPVEIWAEVFDFLLFDAVVFDPNPFYTGCNYHTASRQWRDRSRLMEVAKQHAKLRLVCQAWKNLTDFHRNQYYWLPRDPARDDLAQVRYATRLHFDSERSPCDCPLHCGCSIQPHDLMTAANEERTNAILDKLIEGTQNRTKILLITNWKWSLLAEKVISKQSCQTLPMIAALEVFANLDRIKPISQICPHLVYLNIRYDYDANTSDTIYFTFPSLTTFIVSTPLHDYDSVLRWELPELKHAEITDTYRYAEISSLLTRLLHRSWPKLVSLKASSESYIEIPSNMWSYLPQLRYLGVSSLRSGVNIPNPPDSHPLTTVANIEPESMVETRATLMRVTRDWKGLRTVADSHRWEQLSSPLRTERLPSSNVFDHEHLLGDHCSECIEDMAYICELEGLRYEDCSGRSYEEYLAETFVFPMANVS